MIEFRCAWCSVVAMRGVWGGGDGGEQDEINGDWPESVGVPVAEHVVELG
jgi:hypothetical protein